MHGLVPHPPRCRRTYFEQLSRDGYRSDALHGDLSQAQRDRVMGGFRPPFTRPGGYGCCRPGYRCRQYYPRLPPQYSGRPPILYPLLRAHRTGSLGIHRISLILAHPQRPDAYRRLEKRLKTQFSPVHIPSGKGDFEKRLMGSLSALKMRKGHDAIYRTDASPTVAGTEGISAITSSTAWLP